MRSYSTILATTVALTLGGCVAPNITELTGLDHGPRYAWTKEGSTEREARLQMLDCADTHPGMVETFRLNSIPFVGFAAIPRVIDLQERRNACMDASGYRLVEVRTGRAMRVTNDGRVVAADQPS